VWDLDKLVAIDIHTHATTPPDFLDPAEKKEVEAMRAYFGIKTLPMSTQEMASHYRENKIGCVVFTVDCEARSGFRRYPNEEVAKIVAENSDIMICFASIDPAKGNAGVEEAKRLIQDYNVRGFKFHPSVQGFYPNDKAVYPLYEVIAEAGAVALFHSGQTGVGSGMPGGNGIRLKYSNPIFVDDVAADFPSMPIILAHPSFPWQEEALAVTQHKPNVYIDLSGWSPKYFPPILVQYANTLLKRKMLFGSDYPALTADRWIADFEKIDIRPEVRPLIMKENAIRLLGLR
jgi:predicted TIM-barrel fold metal-dependent hydrolase